MVLVDSCAELSPTVRACIVLMKHSCVIEGEIDDLCHDASQLFLSENFEKH